MFVDIKLASHFPLHFTHDISMMKPKAKHSLFYEYYMSHNLLVTL